MLVKQLSVFIENKKGRLKQMTDVLKTNGINFVTLQVADTKDFGILRSITSDNEKASKVLKEAGFTVSITELIGVEVDDTPGALSDVLGVFDENGLNIEYLYSFTRVKKQSAVILFRVENVAEAVKILQDNKIKTVSDELYI